MTRVFSSKNRFDFEPGKVIGAKYTVESKLGGGTEGEVYRVVERGTDIHRAIKVFYPKRASTEKELRAHARRLHQLRHCPAIVQYIHSTKAVVKGQTVMCLVSELVRWTGCAAGGWIGGSHCSKPCMCSTRSR